MMFVKFSPNQYILRYSSGKLIAEGAGLTFFCIERYNTACAIPIANNDTDFIFEETTADFQKVQVQGQLTYRITDYIKAAQAVDFSVNLRTKLYAGEPMKKLSKRMVNITEVLLKNEIGGADMTDVLQAGETIAEAVLAKLRDSAEILALGAQVTGFSVVKITAAPETARALEAGTREEILRQADDALYDRRNASIEQERRVKENELNTEISVEEKKKKIRETEIQTKRMILEKENELERIRTVSEAERENLRLDAEIKLERKRRELADLRYENAKKEADAEAYRIGAVMEAYSKLGQDLIVALATLNMDPEKTIAQAFEKLAANGNNIGTLNITPDLLESLKRSA
ncbi:MAG: SPFH domain-containing protein [Oscillospiraceae bacterium]|nr:SPFH domain-containing protein [Oscillospiraceae bacterium]